MDKSIFFSFQRMCRYTLLLCLFCVLASGCASKPTAGETRAQLTLGYIDNVTKEIEKHHKSGKDLNIALNLGRLYQAKGMWQESILAFSEAEQIIKDYESRALVNIRGMGSDVGMFTLSRGNKGYFGASYERTLLHTLNSLNYLMLGDIDGAAVELKKMELRQEFWLAEYAEKNQIVSTHIKPLYSTQQLPDGYSAKVSLSQLDLQAPIQYQEPFSYALSAIVHSLAKQQDYADVSFERMRTVLGSSDAQSAASQLDIKKLDTPAYTNSQKPMDIIVIGLSGLAPSLYMQNIRFPAPTIGYVLVDLPSYYNEIYTHTSDTPTVSVGGKPVDMLMLLNADTLAYQNLWNDIKYETSAAVSRAMVRAGVSTGVYYAMSSSKDTRDYAELASLITTLSMDLVAYFSNNDVRNWDTLPAKGFIGIAKGMPGESLDIKANFLSKTITLPTEGNGIIVLVSYLPFRYARIHHVAY